MAFALPGAIGAKLAAPERRVLAAMGDGAFLMNSQEIETAMRERVPLTVLIWQERRLRADQVEMDLELGHDVASASRTRLRGLRGEFRRPRLPGALRR